MASPHSQPGSAESLTSGRRARASALARHSPLATSAGLSADGQSTSLASRFWPSFLSRRGPLDFAAAAAEDLPDKIILSPGDLVVCQERGSFRWVEVMVLWPIEGFECIAVSHDMTLERISLVDDYAAFVAPSPEHPRPAAGLIAAGFSVVTFENGPHGQPPVGAFLAELIQRAQRFAHADESRATVFVDLSDGASEDGTDSDEFIREGHLRGGARRIGGKSKDEDVWIVIFHYVDDGVDPTPFGTIMRASRSLRRLGDFGIDKDASGGFYFTKRLRKSDIPEAVKAIEKQYREAVVPLTPRGDKRAGDLQDDIDNVDKGAGAPPAGGRAAEEDFRVFPLVTDVTGRQRRDFFITARELTEATVSDWPLTGPRSMRWCLSFIGDQCNTGPSGRMQQFMSLCKLTFSDKYVSEYAVLCKIVEYAVQYDQLRVSNLACMELVSRRLQLIEEKYRFRMPQMEGQAGVTDPENDHSLFMGLGTAATTGRQSIMVMPELSSFIGEELAKEAAISKGKLKAHELREGLRKMHDPKNNKGKRRDDE